MPKITDKPKSFEAALSELESIVSAMESSELPLEQALSQYERGIRLLRYCDDTLAGAEQKIRVLENEQLVPLPSEEDAEE
ncbi:exodeoxyribonuclease VII small subunit [Niveibacterium sp. SC-1]|uniref:exodeoxyribonuclease VII small subunit n=1 Tax=Niveibacterium sp. SC-1 TaxID=3135646 RepID=UPI00311DC9F2